MADSAVVVSGKYRKLSQVAVVKNGKYIEITEIPVVVSGKYRKSYESFDPHIDARFYSTSSQSVQTGWTIDKARVTTALGKGYDAIWCHELEVVEGQLIWYVEITWDDNTTSYYSLPTPPTEETEKYITINSNVKSVSLYYFSNNGNYAGGIGEFDFV